MPKVICAECQRVIENLGGGKGEVIAICAECSSRLRGELKPYGFPRRRYLVMMKTGGTYYYDPGAP